MASMSLPEAIRGSASAAIAANTKSGAIITVNDLPASRLHHEWHDRGE